MGKYFGTDGIRGVANEDLNVDLALKFGRVVGLLFSKEEDRNVVVIGNDTRQSGSMLKMAVIAGLCSTGVDIIDLKVIPTPAIAYLTKYYGARAGIVISASHNPWQYNGIKVFDKDGHKLSLELEERIEELLEKDKITDNDWSKGVGKVLEKDNYLDIYIDHLLACVKNKISNFRIAIDCANGSASETAPLLFKRLGSCECHFLNNNPDGMNINLNCGSTNIENLKNYVVENKLDCGIAYDGDADRCFMVDETGKVLDGDILLALLAKSLLARDKLKKKTVVGTVMSNGGLKEFCENNGLDFVMTKVGERHILEEMISRDYSLGGEESGHIILGDYSTTGDGELTSLKILEYMSESEKKLAELGQVVEKYPKILTNIPISEEQKKNFYDNVNIQKEIKRVADELGNAGRILVRASGTEPLLRVMVEGKDVTLIEKISLELADYIKRQL